MQTESDMLRSIKGCINGTLIFFFRRRFRISFVMPVMSSAQPAATCPAIGFDAKLVVSDIAPLVIPSLREQVVLGGMRERQVPHVVAESRHPER